MARRRMSLPRPYLSSAASLNIERNVELFLFESCNNIAAKKTNLHCHAIRTFQIRARTHVHMHAHTCARVFQGRKKREIVFHRFAQIDYIDTTTAKAHLLHRRNASFSWRQHRFPCAHSFRNSLFPSSHPIVKGRDKSPLNFESHRRPLHQYNKIRKKKRNRHRNTMPHLVLGSLAST